MRNDAPDPNYMKGCSNKSYAVSVCLSSVLGYIGIQHFYLGRYFEGIIDVLLTIAWIYFFATGKILYAVVFIIADVVHSLTVTFLLLTGKFRDGNGRLVCYPGQVL